MNFHHFVKKYTKAVFIFICIVMVIPLVLWGYMAPGGQDDDANEDAGILFQTIHVSKGEYRKQLYRAKCAYYWKVWQSSGPSVLLQGRLPEPKEEDLARVVWPQLVLLQEAKDDGIVATDNDTSGLAARLYMDLNRAVMSMGGRLPPFSEDLLSRIGQDLFHTHPVVFREWLNDQAMIEKLLDYGTQATFADYEKIYDEVLRQEKMARVSYAAFDPRDYVKEAKPVRPEEVAKYFQDNKLRFKIPEKIQVSYLLAEFETFKKTVADPTEEEIQKYYDENKAEFTVTPEHKHEPGETHREDEPPPTPQQKPLAEVRDQVIDRKKLAKAREEVRKVMDQVNQDIGESKKDGKYPADLFETLREKYKAKNAELVHDITIAFDSKGVEDVEKFVGKDSRLQSWGFEKSRAEGDISDKVVTDKGAVIYRVEKKKEAYEPDLNEQIRERIEKVLLREQLRKRAGQLASNVVQEINSRGFAAARLKHGGEWKTSRYFKVPGWETGIEDWQLSQRITQQISGKSLSLEKRATTISGFRAQDPEKEGLAYVVYLEDLYETAPEDVDAAFKQSRERMDTDARRRARERFITSRMEAAAVQDFMSKSVDKKETPPVQAPGAPPVKVPVSPQAPKK